MSGWAHSSDPTSGTRQVVVLLLMGGRGQRRRSESPALALSEASGTQAGRSSGVWIGAVLPGCQLFWWERLEEAVVYRYPAAESTELASASRPVRHELGDGLAAASDHDLFAVLYLREQTREFSLRDGDVENRHYRRV